MEDGAVWPMPNRTRNRFERAIERRESALLQHPFEHFERNEVALFEWPGGESPERTDVGSATEQLTDLLDDRSHIRSFAAVDRERHFVAFERDDLVAEDRDHARLALHLDAAPREPVERLALVLHRGEHRRHLLDIAAKIDEHAFDRVAIEHTNRTGRNHLAVRVAAVSTHTELHADAILLVRCEQELRELRRFAEAKRQH